MDGSTPGTSVDLDMLANDIANMLDEYEYPVDATAETIRPALPAFLAQIQQTATPRSAQ